MITEEQLERMVSAWAPLGSEIEIVHHEVRADGTILVDARVTAPGRAMTLMQIVWAG